MKYCLFIILLFKCTFGFTQITTNCVTWINGNLPDQDIVNSADNLCSEGLIPNVIDVSTLPYLNIADASLYTLNALYHNNIPTTVTSDYFPIFFGDLDNLSAAQLQAVKAMCFLEYGDGRPCLTRDFTQLQPMQVISIGYELRMLYEAWNVAPDTVGYNVFDSSPSSFLSYIDKNDYDYGYFQQAYLDGFLSKYIQNGELQQGTVSPGEFYLFLLNEINSKYGNAKPFITSSSFHTPNNIQLSNANTNTDITRGVFKTYEQNGFNIPSGGLGLNFIYSYHSDWLDIPTLGYSYTNYQNVQNSNLIDEEAKQHNFPLGLGWTHSYNITAQTIFDSNSNDKLIIIRWGDGSIEVYNTVTAKFESEGVYDKLTVTGMAGNHISSFTIVSKNQITTTFASSSNNSSAQFFFQATQISDPNGNTIKLLYEAANCTTDPSDCAETSNRRLSIVQDSYSGRELQFQYTPNTDLLSAVIDQSGSRSIQFIVNKYTLNLDAVTNAKNNITHYNYGVTDTANNLLVSIQRPLGNTINNTYYDKKLHSSQTSDYTSTINFSTNYGSSNVSTQSIVSNQPQSNAVSYAYTYTQNSNGSVTSIVSASTNITESYNDSNNPTQPTSIVDNITGLTKTFVYDGQGNTLESDVSRNGLTQTNHFTYDQTNHVLTHTSPNNTLTSYTYDSFGNQTGEYTSPFQIQYGYSQNGLLANQTDGSGVTSNYGYNQYGNLNLISYSNSPVTFSASYDTDSRLQYIQDGNGVQTTYAFDPNDNLSGVIIDPNKLNISTQYTYDSNDNLATITPPSGGITTLTYDGNDNISEESQQSTVLFRSWNYNEDSSLKTYIDKKRQLFSYLYYPLNDPNEGKLSSNGFQNYIYDTNTRLLNSVTTNQTTNGTIQYGYDQLLRPNDIKFNGTNFSSEVSYNYDISGNVTQITLPNEGKYFTYVYDPLNRLQSIQDWNSVTLVTYTYKNNNLLDHEVFSNGTTVFYHYDTANRLDSIYSLKSDLKTLLHAIGATLDNNGNHLKESYFVLWPGNPGKKYYQQSTFVIKPNAIDNTPQEINSTFPNSDANGNILSNPFEQFNNGTYDIHNNLISCTDNGTQRSFSYDALESQYAFDSLSYVIDHVNNGNVLEVKNNTTSTSTLYVYSPNGLVCSIDPQTSDATFYLYDFRGSTVATIDKNQNVTDYYKYDPWGNVTEATSTPGVPTPFLFVGKYGVMYDSPHLYYMRARYYDPILGRFYGADSKWSTNLFSYAGNSPILNIDPNGQSQENFNLPANFNSVAQSIIPESDLEIVLTNPELLNSVEENLYSVYQAVDKEGIVKYVGITMRSPEIRFAEHLNAFGTGKEFLNYYVLDDAVNLTRNEARIVEQQLINEYGLDQLLNKINSISEKYWSDFGIK